jgi:hypothetical protein
MVGQRLVDLVWNLIVSMLKFVMQLHWAQRLASALITPLSLGFYVLALMFDEINKEDALGWVVLARK